MTVMFRRDSALLTDAPGAIEKLRRLVRQLAVAGELTAERRPGGGAGWKHVKFGDVFSLEYGENLPAPKRSSTGEFPVYGSNGVVGSHVEACVHSSCLVVGRKGSAGAVNVCEHNGCWVTDVAYYTVPPDGVTLRYAYLLFLTLGLDELGKGIKPGLSRNEAYILPISIPPLAEQHYIVAKVDELMVLCDRLEARQQDAKAAHARLVRALLDSLTQARDAEGFQACWRRVADQLEGVFTTEASIDDLERAVLELAISGRLTRAGSMGDVSADLAAVRQERARYLSTAKLKKHDADADEVYWACPYALPERWAWVSLAAVVLQITDGTHHTPTYVDDGTPFISVKDLDGETVSFEDCRRIPNKEHVAINERCNPERGDILICRIGTLGRPTIVDTDRAFSIFVSVGLLKMPKSIELAEYIHLVLRSPLAYRQYDRIKAGGSHTNKLNLGDIPKIMVPLPPAEERAEILAVVGEVLGLCSMLRSRIAAARGKHAQLAEALVAQAVAS